MGDRKKGREHEFKIFKKNTEVCIAYKNTNIFIGSDFYRSHIFFLFKKINCYLLPLKTTAFGFTQMKRGGPTQPCYLKKKKITHKTQKKINLIQIESIEE